MAGLARAAGELGGLVLAAGAVGIALVLAGQAAHVTIALADAPSPSAAAGLFGAGNALFAVAWLPLAVFAAAVSLAGPMPRPLAAAGLVLAPVLAATAATTLLGAGLPPAAGLLAFLAWVAAASVALLVARDGRFRPPPEGE